MTQNIFAFKNYILLVINSIQNPITLKKIIKKKFLASCIVKGIHTKVHIVVVFFFYEKYTSMIMQVGRMKPSHVKFYELYNFWF